MINIKIIEYFDLFGTKFNFYIDGKQKLYTMFGGIFSIFSILICISIFIGININDFKRENPVISIAKKNYNTVHEIKFGEEKIWLPWRIVDYNENYFNHSGIFYPTINFYYKEEINDSEKIIIKSEKLNYKLCNETSMLNKTDIYHIDLPLNELYCIDMDNIYKGKSWINSFFYYIEFNLYLRKDCIDYNETYPYYSKYEDLNEYEMPFNIELYYPTFQFQSDNLTAPVIIFYKKYSYHLSEYTLKKNKLYLQQYILNNDLNWLITKSNKYSYWAFKSITSDFYYNPLSQKNALLNFSKIYSMSIFLDSETIYYKRHYKKIFTILKENLPIIYIIFIILSNIAKIFKLSYTNEKLTELLFDYVAITKKGLKFNSVIPHTKLKKSSNIQIKKKVATVVSRKDNSYSSYLGLNGNVVNSPNLFSKNFMFHDIRKQKCLGNSNSNPLMLYANFNENKRSHKGKNSDVEGSLNNRKKINNIKSSENHKNSKKETNISIIGLFPFRYYFFWQFIRSLKITENNLCFSKKFVNYYSFICKKFDVSYYFLLLKEFTFLKQKILSSSNFQFQNIGDNTNNFIAIDLKDNYENKNNKIIGNHIKK